MRVSPWTDRQPEYRYRVADQNQIQKFTRMTRCYRTLLKFGFYSLEGGNGLYHWRHCCLALRCRRALEGIEGAPG